MATLARRAITFALYQLSIVLGIVLFPLALAARQAGLALPIHRVVDRLAAAHEHAME